MAKIEVFIKNKKMSKKHTLSKTNYIQYLDCPEELWLQKNKPEVLPKIDLDRLYKLEQGNLIDKLAQEWFLDGCVIQDWLINPDDVEFQMAAKHGQMIAIADIVVHQPEKKTLALFEVKAATGVKKEHYHDLAFQRMVFEASGYQVNGTYLVHVNKAYRTGKGVNHCDFMVIEDISEKVEELLKETKAQAKKALAWIAEKAPEKRITLGCSNKLKCPFVQMHYKNLPDYSIYNISRISGKKVKNLVDKGILDIQDVPEDFKLSALQRQQVEIAQEDEIILKRGSIRRIVKKLEYPIYYLDYESFSYVLPPQVDYKPYQQMVFQYSLHVQEKPGGALTHHEYVLDSKEEPVDNLIKHLESNIGEKGSVIVWNESFEKGRNKEMAVLFPIHQAFLLDLNDRMYDLRIPFQKGYYQHPDFRGKTSLKSILPVLAPEVSYKVLNIQNGMIATIKWHHATEGKVSAKAKKQIIKDLKKYCHLDTLAMVKILDVLREI